MVDTDDTYRTQSVHTSDPAAAQMSWVAINQARITDAALCRSRMDIASTSKQSGAISATITEKEGKRQRAEIAV